MGEAGDRGVNLYGFLVSLTDFLRDFTGVQCNAYGFL